MDKFSGAEKQDFSAEGAEGAQRTRRRSESVDRTRNTVAHMRDIEIQEVAQPEATKTKVAQQLTAMNRRDGFNSL